MSTQRFCLTCRIRNQSSSVLWMQWSWTGWLRSTWIRRATWSRSSREISEGYHSAAEEQPEAAVGIYRAHHKSRRERVDRQRDPKGAHFWTSLREFQSSWRATTTRSKTSLGSASSTSRWKQWPTSTNTESIFDHVQIHLELLEKMLEKIVDKLDAYDQLETELYNQM